MQRHELPFSVDGEPPRFAARTLAITDRRMVIGDEHRVAMDLPIEAIRRIQFDVERGRPATFVVVPHDPADEPQVLAVPYDELEAVSQIVYTVGAQLQAMDHYAMPPVDPPLAEAV